MITLTTPINIPNLARVQVVNVSLDEDNAIAVVDLDVTSAGGLRYSRIRLKVCNGASSFATSSEKIARNASPANYDDAIATIALIDIPNGFTNLAAAWYGATNTKTARRRAAEMQGLADGWIDASLTGTVS